MKRRFGLMVLAALLAGGWPGCGGRDSGGEPGRKDERADAPATRRGGKIEKTSHAPAVMQGAKTQPVTRMPKATGKKVREAAVAGLFYPKDKAELAETIDRHLRAARAEDINQLRALICPHAGYRFSGPTAAFAYKQLIGRDIDTVIVLAPSHYADFEGASIPEADAYRTPLGLIRLSPLADELAKVKPFVRECPCRVQRPGWAGASPKKPPPPGEDTPHTWEHSLEVQLPFLQKVLGDFSLVPVVLGRVDPAAVAKALAGRLDEKTILIVSTDLSHFHPYQTAIRMDRRCIDAIRGLDTKALGPRYACGYRAVLAAMHLARMKGWKVRLLDYRNSGDTAGDKRSVVGYAAMAFHGGAR